MAKKIKAYDDIIGHKNKVRYIQECVRKDNVPDVIIFYGNPGLGKSSIAKLLAIDITTKYAKPELRETYIKAVIEEDKSTDSIKIFNMSEIQEKEEEIQKVKAELSVGFSSTGYKVLILDEGHNMSKKAQDSILTDLEYLPENVYVFICTTEIEALREALKSRGKAKIRLNDLTIVETKKLIASIIADRHLTFDINVNMAIALIADWAGNQPRKICNLLENFEVGSLVTSKDLEVFIDTSSVSAVIELLKYIYGSLPLGIDYIDSLKIDNSFVNMVIEVCKVALGHISSSVSPKDTMFIKNFMKDRDVQHILQFTIEVAGLDTLLKRRIVSAFMRANINYKNCTVPVADKGKSYQTQDLFVLSQNIEIAEDVNTGINETRVMSIEEMFGNSEVIE